MTKDPTSWPLLLCGPILRRVEPTEVSVFVALKHERGVKLTVKHDASVVAVGTTPTTKFGKYLHATVVTAVSTSGALVPGKIYTYDLELTRLAFRDPLDTDPPDVKTLASPDLARADSLLDGELPLGYVAGAYPGFALPPTELKDLRLVHASCRKPHGEGRDALPILDTIIRDSHSKPLERPHQLFLTGDQIYADDVAVPLLEQLSAIGNELLHWTPQEPLHPQKAGGTAPTEDAVKPGFRNRVVKPPLTSGEAGCHLIRLGEFYAMYLFAWSDALWPDKFEPRVTPVWPPAPVSDEQARKVSGEQRVAKLFNEQIPALKSFSGSLGKVRRALANVPTYMIFDDHEVTDDWYLDKARREEIFDSPLGKQIVTNALSAYVVFQAWGNDPASFAQGTNGGMFLSDLSQWHGQPVMSHDAALGTATESSPPMLRFDYMVSGPAHDVIVLDTRTRRGYLIGADTKAAADLLPLPEIDIQVVNRITSATNRKRLTVVVSAAPVFGAPLVEWLLRGAASENSPLQLIVSPETALDRETWLVSVRRRVFERLLEALVPCGSVMILSGDVHYGFSHGIRYWNSRDSVGTRAAFVQLVSSALKNQACLTKAIGHMWPEQAKQLLGWADPGRHVMQYGPSTPISHLVYVAGSPAVHELDARNQMAIHAPQWSYQAGLISDARPLEVRTGKARLPAPPATSDPLQRMQDLAMEHRHTAKNDQMRTVVGFNNIATVRFAATPSSAAQPMLLVEHALWFRLKGDIEVGLPYTVQWGDLTPPTANDPRPEDSSPTGPLPAAAAAWADLISFRPSTNVQAAAKVRGLKFERIEKAWGRIILDRYAVRVAVMPTVNGTQMDANALLRHFRLKIVVNPATFVDKLARFVALDAQDVATWGSASPVGALMNLQTKLEESILGDEPAFNGRVVVTDSADDHWMFSSVWTAAYGNGPMTGNRRFGYEVVGNDHIYVISGAHRISGPLFATGESTQVDWADNFLRSMQKELMLFVNGHAGTAELVQPRIINRYSWDLVGVAHHHPTTNWIP